MAFNLKNRNLLSLLDYSAEEILFLTHLSKDLKAAKYAGTEKKLLKGKNIALIFEKQSTRTRCAFEVACFDQGAHVSYLEPSSSHIGTKESIKDTARVLGRFYDAIEYRGFGQEIIEVLAEYAKVPVYNGLTTEFHPTQMLADLLTMVEHSFKPIHKISYCFIGDGQSNIANSLLLLGAKLGMNVHIAAPKSLWPSDSHIQKCKKIGQESNAKISILEDPKEAVKNVDFIYTDVWVSMGENSEKWNERIETLLPYQVTQKLMDATGNPEVKFLHCLPAFHNTETKFGKELAQKYPKLQNGIEVTEEVFESKASVVFDQAENRMHTIKAVLVATLA